MDSEPVLKLDADDDLLGQDATTGESAVVKPKTPRVKKDKKEPGENLDRATVVVAAQMGSSI